MRPDGAGGFTFSGSRSSRTGNTGRAHAEVVGRLSVQQGQIVVDLDCITNNGNAAVIGGAEGGTAGRRAFTAESTTVYRARVLLQPVQAQ